jgi:hypothetical protein
MTKKLASIGRRTVLASASGAIIFPRHAFSQQGRNFASQEPTNTEIRLTFNGRTLTATLYDNPSARDFASMLPLDLTIDNYANNEKIAYLPRKITEEDSRPFGNERPYDLATSSLGATWRCSMPTIGIPVASSGSAVSMMARMPCACRGNSRCASR